MRKEVGTGIAWKCRVWKCDVFKVRKAISTGTAWSESTDRKVVSAGISWKCCGYTSDALSEWVQHDVKVQLRKPVWLH